ncbi:MAG: hypothetical protein HYY84_10315 [Deltaproteobacteria bacterium]|nr:hypothetical protein [Deltaproteobacteria bacterium]
MDRISPNYLRGMFAVGRGIVGVLALTTAQCGAGAGLRVEYERLSTFPRVNARGEHVAVAVPLSVVQALIEKKLAERAIEKSFGFPVLGLGIKVALRRVAIESTRACAECLGLRVMFDVTAGKQAPASIEVAGEFPVEAALLGGRVDISLRLSRARALVLKLAAGWKEKVAAWVAALAPRGLLRKVIQSSVPAVIDKLSSGVLALARAALAGLGVDLDRFARFSFALPALKPGTEIPLNSVSVRSTDDSVVAVATTTLSTSDDPLDGMAIPAGPWALTMLVRGQTLFDAVLYAMSRGLAPSRFNAKGKPDPKGDFRVSFEWRQRDGGTVRVHFWKLSSPAGVVTLEGKLSLALAADRSLEVKTDGLRVVSKRGDFLFEVGVWLKSELWGTTHDMVKKVAIPASIKIGGRNVPVSIRRVRVIDSGVVVESDLPTD